jgi:hypothetical protein
MSCIYVHNDAFHCRHFPGKFLRAIIIFNIHHQHQHNRGISGRGFVTIGHKTSEAAAPPPTKPSSFILRLCLCNYLYFSSLPTYYVPPWFYLLRHGLLNRWTAMPSVSFLTSGQHEAGTWDPNYTPGVNF